MCGLIVLEVGSQKSDCQLPASSEGCEEHLPRPLSLARRWPLPLASSHCPPSMRVCLWVQLSLFYEDIGHIGLGAPCYSEGPHLN